MPSMESLVIWEKEDMSQSGRIDCTISRQPTLFSTLRLFSSLGVEVIGNSGSIGSSDTSSYDWDHSRRRRSRRGRFGSLPISMDWTRPRDLAVFAPVDDNVPRWPSNAGSIVIGGFGWLAAVSICWRGSDYSSSLLDDFDQLDDTRGRSNLHRPSFQWHLLVIQWDHQSIPLRIAPLATIGVLDSTTSDLEWPLGVVSWRTCANFNLESFLPRVVVILGNQMLIELLKSTSRIGMASMTIPHVGTRT